MLCGTMLVMPNPRLDRWLTNIALGSGAICTIGFVSLVGVSIFANLGQLSTGFIIASIGLPTIAAGIIAVIAFVVRELARVRWRFSIATLLFITTAAALALAFFTVILRSQ
jgi:hypothetical protein